MLHCIKYELKMLIRNKIIIFWLLGFPMILGTLFFAAFGSLADSEADYRQMPIAVIENGEAPQGFDTLILNLSSGSDALFNIVTRDSDTAREMMGKGELEGIIYAYSEISLEVPQGAGVKAGIIKSVLDIFKNRSYIISDIAEAHPEKLNEILEEIMSEVSCVNSSSNSANKDPYVQYFYNLIAMSGLMGSTMGMYCAVNHQANLSPNGQRVEVSPVGKLKDISCSLISTVIIHNVFLNIASLYLVFVLGIRFGVDFWVIALVNFLGSVLGDCLGCFVGSFAGLKNETKNGMVLCATLGMCFLSGLMFGGMRLIIEENCPVVNRINPAALIVDCFYSTCVYGSYEKLAYNIIVLLIWCVLLLTGSAAMLRKREYKSL